MRVSPSGPSKNPAVLFVLFRSLRFNSVPSSTKRLDVKLNSDLNFNSNLNLNFIFSGAWQYTGGGMYKQMIINVKRFINKRAELALLT